ncbi:MAG: hypothetical protein AAFR82_12240 [Pseudomonadota bacterium]
MKRIALLILLSPVLAQPSLAGETPALTPEVFDVIVGDDWSGALTYLNYGEPVKDFTIPAELEVERVERGVKIAYKYPDEPHQNSTVTARLNEDGSQLMGAAVTVNDIGAAGAREIRTEYACEDMGKTAECEMIYELSSDRVVMRKMVTYSGEADAFRRSEYVFTR